MSFENWMRTQTKLSLSVYETLYPIQYSNQFDAYQAGKAEQKETDADLAGKWFIPVVDDDICTKAGMALADAIRNQEGR